MCQAQTNHAHTATELQEPKWRLGLDNSQAEQKDTQKDTQKNIENKIKT
jgi:hypothetical protein